LIDAGNSRAKWAVANHEGTTGEDTWLADGAVATALFEDALPQLASLITTHTVQHVDVSNVAGPRAEALIRRAVAPLEPRFHLAQKEAFGIRNQYFAPIRLGIDRYAALVAVHHFKTFEKMSKLVVTAGTALTLDALTHEGVFLGGGIAPGLEVMRRALNRDTADLPLAADNDLPEDDDFGRTTEEAIASGARDAAVGAVLMSAQRLARHTDTPILIVLAGGSAPVLSMPLKSNLHQFGAAITIEDNLVLQGLLRMAVA
jgi:type III pantothenate kinase